MRITVFFSLLLMAGLAGSVTARISESWTYNQMFAKADLVVVGRRVVTKDLNERTTLTDVTPSVGVIGLITEFEPLLILKGEKNITQLLLHHYRFESDKEQNVVNSPDLIRFTDKHPIFLLFLTKESGGRYVPVTGQTDPAAFSVLELKGGAQ
jgi:hypothetical protein